MRPGPLLRHVWRGRSARRALGRPSQARRLCVHNKALSLCSRVLPPLTHAATRITCASLMGGNVCRQKEELNTRYRAAGRWDRGKLQVGR
jgi:hypothetical protein